MRNTKSLAKIWAQVPPNYYDRGIFTNPLQRLWHMHKIATFKHLAGQKSHKMILDVGCAGGFMINKVAQIFPIAQVFGIDVYKKAIEYATKKHPQITFVVADAHKIPFNDNVFDLVICYETIEHVVNPKKILKEIKRVLEKNGVAIVTMDSGILLFRIIWWFWEKTYGKAWQGAHLHSFHHHQLETLIKQSGLKIVKKHFSHFGMEVSFVCQKKR